MREKVPGEIIEEGDVIRAEHRHFGVKKYRVHRTTKNFAFVRYNEHAEGKFRIEVNGFGAHVIPHPKWPENTYTVWTDKPLPQPQRTEEK